MAVTKTKVNLGGLARKLILENILDKEVAQDAHQKALAAGMPFVAYLVANRLADDSAIDKAAPEKFGVPLLDISAIG